MLSDDDPSARIDQATTVRGLEVLLRESGFSRREAKHLLAIALRATAKELEAERQVTELANSIKAMTAMLSQ